MPMTERQELILALGSNCEQEESMAEAQSKLREMFGRNIIFSKCAWTEPIGIKSDKFLNCLAFTYTSHNIENINKAVKHIEKKCGSRKRARTNNIIKMDIDILKYGKQILHGDDWNRKYVINLMKECPF